MAAMAAEDRNLVNIGEGPDVILPLQEVLKNLPKAALRMRRDQETQELGSNIATPFSAKAEEDAKRFSGGIPTEASSPPATTMAAVNKAEVAKESAPVAKEQTPVTKQAVAVAHEQTPVVKEAAPAAKERAKVAKEPASVAKEKVQVAKEQTEATKKAAGLEQSTSVSSQPAIEKEQKVDDKELVARVSNLPGIKACSLIFNDGLSLAGSLPIEYAADGLCAMAPSLMRRIETHLVETRLGPLRNMTVSCTKGAVTFFTDENLCLAALHESSDLTLEVQEELAKAVHELSQKYSHPV